jgi:N-acylneuraminate cytidylyltransferase
MFDRVCVSTEDHEIGQAALNAGAELIQRPEELAQDRSTVVQVCRHALELMKKDGAFPEFFCCLYATAVFITPEDLVRSFQLFLQEPAPDVVMGVSEFNLHPVQALKEMDGFLYPKWPEYIDMQSQFHPRLVASNGTFYWARADSFVLNPSFYPAKLMGYTIPKLRAIDMDTEDDLKLARLVAAQMDLQAKEITQ